MEKALTTQTLNKPSFLEAQRKKELEWLRLLHSCVRVNGCLPGQWRRTPVIPAPRSRDGQIFESEASMVYRASSKTTKATQRNLILNNKTVPCAHTLQTSSSYPGRCPFIWLSVLQCSLPGASSQSRQHWASEHPATSQGSTSSSVGLLCLSVSQN